MIYEKPGPIHTDETLAIALKLAEEHHTALVIASNTGRTVDALLALTGGVCPVPVVMVTQVCGFSKPGEAALAEADYDRLAAQGVRIVRASHVLSGAERGLSTRFGGVYPVEIIAHTLRMLSQGVKVCVECAVMALDNGAIPYGTPVVCVGGTGRGADTVALVTPAHANAILDTRIHDIAVKPF